MTRSDWAVVIIFALIGAAAVIICGIAVVDHTMPPP